MRTRPWSRRSSTQVAAIAHTSNLFCHEPVIALAEKLVSLLGGNGRAFFANSGTEANEAAYKLVRRHAGPEPQLRRGSRQELSRPDDGRPRVDRQAVDPGALRPYGADVVFVPYGDADALAAAVTDRTAGLFLEPMLGEGGVIAPPAGYLRAAREICTATGAAVRARRDPVRHRPHRRLVPASRPRGSGPDVITLAKGLGGGLPIGVVYRDG